MNRSPNRSPSTLTILRQPFGMVDARDVLRVLFGLNRHVVASSFPSTISYGREVILGKKVMKSTVDGVDTVDE